MGQPQFMPSSYLRYAEDFDGDGQRDIWGSQADVFASIANYLKAYGWDGTATWGRAVRLPAPVKEIAERAGSRGEGCRAERALTRRQSLAEWEAMGVRTATGASLPKVDRTASLLAAGGSNYLVYGNYEAILGYNCANAYALSVAMLGDRLP
jgi:membrane-bound lytic murein transglycosylase B